MSIEGELLATLSPDERARTRAAPIPTRVDPQLAAPDAGSVPPGWWFERKFDGYRLLSHLDDGGVVLHTRNHVALQQQLPELVAAWEMTGLGAAVIDGELVAAGEATTAFSQLQRRLGPEARAVSGPVTALDLHVFDLLHLGGLDLRRLPLNVRRRLLEQLPLQPPLRLTERSWGAGPDQLAAACRAGWEGLVAKDPNASYRSGRSGRWRKLPCVAREDLVVGGWTEPRGSRTGFGALLLGYHDAAGRLRYAGRVGTGFDQETLQALGGLLERLRSADRPFAEPVDVRANFIAPLFVVEVSFTGWTRHGRLRHPRFVRLRVDRDPHEVVLEPGG